MGVTWHRMTDIKEYKLTQKTDEHKNIGIKDKEGAQKAHFASEDIIELNSLYK